MTMLFYIDESGHPHPHDAATRPVIVAVGIPIERSRELARSMHSLKRGLSLATDPWLEEKYKAHAIFNHRTRRRQPVKWQYLEGVINIAVSFPVVTFSIVMERPIAALMSGPGLLPYHWHCLLHRINSYLAAAGSGRSGLLIMDSQDGKSDALLSVQISNFLFRSEVGRRLTHIVETPLFVNSAITPGIQIADLFAAGFRQHHEWVDGDGVDDAYGQAIQGMYRAMRQTIYDHHDAFGRIWYGEYLLPAERMIASGGESLSESSTCMEEICEYSLAE
jgi:hypothetical protein